MSDGEERESKRAGWRKRAYEMEGERVRSGIVLQTEFL